jgi:hypothetical protein
MITIADHLIPKKLVAQHVDSLIKAFLTDHGKNSMWHFIVKVNTHSKVCVQDKFGNGGLVLRAAIAI